MLENVDAAVILGSGLSGAFADDELEIVGAIGTGVEGHRGALALWRLDGRTVLVALGRRHLYEGIDPRETTRMVELAASRGARHIVVTNAAGGLNPHYHVGDIMLIAGLSALMLGRQLPLLQDGKGDGRDGGREGDWRDWRDGGDGGRERDVGVARGGRDEGGRRDGGSGRDGEDRRDGGRGLFDPGALRVVYARALERGVTLRQGVYAAVSGPSYETRAEIRMLRLMGADAVGMSTVPEYLAAARLGLRVTGLSLITNTLSDTSRVELDHGDVVIAGERARRAMRLAIEAALGTDGA